MRKIDFYKLSVGQAIMCKDKMEIISHLFWDEKGIEFICFTEDFPPFSWISVYRNCKFINDKKYRKRCKGRKD